LNTLFYRGWLKIPLVNRVILFTCLRIFYTFVGHSCRDGSFGNIRDHGLGGGAGKQGQVEKHVHGAEEKTPLEAISHGPIVQAGEKAYPFISDTNLIGAVFMAILFEKLRCFVPSNAFSHSSLSCYSTDHITRSPWNELYSLFEGRRIHNSLVQVFPNFRPTRNIESTF